MTDVSAAPKPFWSFERSLAVINVIALVIGSTIGVMTFLPKHRSDMRQDRLDSLNPTEDTSTLKISKTRDSDDGGQTALYIVDLSISSTNHGKEPIDYSYLVLKTYLGDLNGVTVPAHSVLQINAVPDIDPMEPPKPPTTAPVSWKLQNCAAFLDQADDSLDAMLTAQCSGHVEEGGGLTGRFNPGMLNSYATRFFVRGHPGDYFGVAYTYALNKAVKSDSPDVKISDDYVILP